MAETWLPLPRDDRYEVSDLGRVRSWASKGRNSHTRAQQPRVLKQANGSKGYLAVFPGGRFQLVHRMVLETFRGPCPDGMLACHGNGVRTDNRLENLRWDTPEANCADELLHGTSNRGMANNTAKLTESDVLYIRRSPEATSVLARRFGVTRVHIQGIRKRKTWAWLEPEAS